MNENHTNKHHAAPIGARGLIVSVDCDTHPAQMDGMSRHMTQQFGIPVVVVNRPVQVHAVPDIEHGLKNSAGHWIVNVDGVVISGTKARMCAKRDSAAEYGDTYTVEPLPTE